MKDWIVLSATLPASPSGLRVRVWRALKATGAGTPLLGRLLLYDALAMQFREIKIRRDPECPARSWCA